MKFKKLNQYGLYSYSLKNGLLEFFERTSVDSQYTIYLTGDNLPEDCIEEFTILAENPKTVDVFLQILLRLDNSSNMYKILKNIANSMDIKF